MSAPLHGKTGERSLSSNHNKAAVVQKQQASDDVVDQQALGKDVARDVQKK